MRPSLRQLEYFVAVADKLNFRQAAEACYVTQPALSAQIQQLETLLGVILFERDRRKVVMTAAGTELVARARALLAAAEELVDAASAHRGPLSGTLRLGVIPTVAPYLLPQVLPAVHRKYPNLRLLLREEQTERLVDLLARGQLDLLLLALEAELGDVETLPLFEDPFVLALHPDHELAKARRRTVKESELGDQPVLLLDDGHCLRDQALRVCDKAGAKELGDFRASSLGTLVQMVASGVGVTLLPAMAVGIEARPRRRLAVKAFARPCPKRTIGLAFRRTSPRKEEFRALGELFRAHGPTSRLG